MKQFYVLSLILLLLSCTSSIKSDRDQLFEVDRRFSDAATKTGFNKAFIEFAHPDAVLLRTNSMPIVGKTSIAAIYEKADTTGVRFSWEPISGEIAASGDLGYTYGIYTLKIDTLTEKGTYVSIWKKDDNGNWKYVLDSGNEGLGE